MLVCNEYSETGTEGMEWILYDTDYTGYEGMRFLKDGMHIRIYNHDNSIAFEGIIDKDTETGWEPYPYYLTNPVNLDDFNSPDKKLLTMEEIKEYGLGQQVSNNFWSHWLQRNYDSEKWGQLFLQDPPLRAEILG